MKIEKRDTEKRERSSDGYFGTFGQKEVARALYGLTREVAFTPDGVYARADNGGPYCHLTIHKTKCNSRTARYDFRHVVALRDCLILLNEVGQNTVLLYAGRNDEVFSILRTLKPSADDYERIHDVVSDHLKTMGLRLRMDYGGCVIVDDELHKMAPVNAGIVPAK